METTLCNYCGSSAARVRFSGPDLLLNRLTPEYTLVQCTQCGLIYQNPRPDPAEIIEHYPEEYSPYADHGATTRTSWLLARSYAYGWSKRCRYVTQHKQQGRLLDIGCASGAFLRAMTERGNWQVHGVEMNTQVAAYAHERYGLDVLPGRLEDVRYRDHAFDVVTMWDVLEHVHDPHAVLCEIRRILKPDGLLVVRVPNLASLEAGVFGKYWAGLDLPRHLYVFTPASLTRMLARAGLEVVSHDAGIGAYTTFMLSVSFWLSARQAPQPWRQHVLSILGHPLARIATAPLFYFSNFTLKGSLLVTTARVGSRVIDA